MSPTRPQFSINKRGSVRVTLLICLLFLMAVPALADPVTVNQVVQTLSSSQGVPELTLSTLVNHDSGQKGTQQSGPRTDGPGTKTDSIITGTIVTGPGQRIGVETIAEGEVEGTICDCGEIFIAGGGFPKWPFLFLGAIPLAFIDHDCDTCDTPVTTPTPTPTPPSTPTPTPTPQVPEPASLVLFGTGLAAAGAALRRRYGKAEAEERQ
jgi:PEP-CTERM motif-containing protein